MKFGLVRVLVTLCSFHQLHGECKKECSARSCSYLDLVASTYGSNDVCAEVDSPELGGKCVGKKTHEEANHFCRVGGMRLCTMEELENNEARDSGCSLDDQLLWSLTPCGDNHYYTSAGQASYPSTTCSSETDSFYARCCADTHDTVPCCDPPPCETPEDITLVSIGNITDASTGTETDVSLWITFDKCDWRDDNCGDFRYDGDACHGALDFKEIEQQPCRITFNEDEDDDVCESGSRRTRIHPNADGTWFWEYIFNYDVQYTAVLEEPPPTPSPTSLPTPQPTTIPTPLQTLLPTPPPTPLGTAAPEPTPFPSAKPTHFPTLMPIPQPTLIPTLAMVPVPTLVPVADVPQPTFIPTFLTTAAPTPKITDTPATPPISEPETEPETETETEPETFDSPENDESEDVIVVEITGQLLKHCNITEQNIIELEIATNYEASFELPCSYEGIPPSEAGNPENTIEEHSVQEYTNEERHGEEVQEPHGEEVEDPHGEEVQEPHGEEVEDPHGEEVQEPHGEELEDGQGQGEDIEHDQWQGEDIEYDQGQGEDIEYGPGEETEETQTDDESHDSSCTILSDDVTYELSVAAIEKSCFPVESQDVLLSDVVEILLSQGDFHQIEFIVPYSTNNQGLECAEGFNMSDSIQCRWFDPESETWDTEGCRVLETDIDLNGTDELGAKCQCDHLTAFAVLLDIEEAQDRCHFSTVLGNALWIVFACLYIVLLLNTFIQLGQLVSTEGCRKSANNIVHVLVSSICTLQIVLALVLYTSDPQGQLSIPIEALDAIWALLYCLSFSAYILVLGTWANVYHTNVQVSKRSSVNRFLIVVFVFLFLSLLVTFVGVSLANRANRENIVLAGSMFVVYLSIFTAIGFLIYGTLLVRKLSTANRINKNPQAVSNFDDTITRIHRVAVVVSVAFIGQSLILLATVLDRNWFFSNFTVLQSVSMALDLVLLSTVLYMFWRVIKSRFRTKLSTEFSVKRPQKPVLETELVQRYNPGSYE